MIERIIDWSLNNRLVVLLLTAALVGGGLYSAMTLPLDAVPDLTNIQVQILTNSPSLGPVEVEQFITFPVETTMSGVPGVEEIRSVSRYGLSAVTVVFEEGTDIYWARQLVSERLQQAREAIPPGMGDPQLGPIATGMSEIYQFEVRAAEGSDLGPMELRTILDWQIAFQLRSVPGVIEVNTFGGELKTFEVMVDPDRLQSFGLSLGDVYHALERNNGNAGGGAIVHGEELRLIRGEGLVGSLDDIKGIVLDSRADGTPIRIRDVATVHFAPMLRQGAVTRDGDREAVIGMVMMLAGENSRSVVADVKEKVTEIAGTLPEGVVIDTFYDRNELVGRTIHTVAENISGGAILVVIMLLLLLGNLRAGLIVAMAIPLSAFGAFIAMRAVGVSVNLMSFGAIDFGVIVDGAVVMVENCVRRASLFQRSSQGRPVPMGVFRSAGKEVGRPILFSGAIVVIVFLPIMTLQGIEGKMFRPMAFVFMTALASALVLSVTVMPVLVSLFLVRRMQERDTMLVRWSKRAYAPVLRWAIKRPGIVATIAAAGFVASGALASRFGAEFIPRLDEGDIAIQATRLPSVSLEASIEMTKAIERTLLEEFPAEVETVVSKTGRPEIANDPMGLHQTDIIVRLQPEENWTFASKEKLVAAMEEALERRVPSNAFSFTQPIELRVQELVAGVRSDVGLSLYGDDLDVLSEKGDEIAAALQRVPGAADVQAAHVAGLPYLRVIIDREAIARYGINARDVLDVIQAAGGRTVGEVFEGQRRFPLQVRLPEEWRNNADVIGQLKINDLHGRPIPLAQLADIRTEDGPAEINRDSIRRRTLIQCNVRGRDLARFVADAQAAVEREVELPPGYVLAWGGQFENLRAASIRLAVAVPVAMFLIVLLLFMTFSSARLAALIFLNVPIAATGGIVSLWLRDMPFSISAGVGFIALFGIAVMNGVVLIEHIRRLRQEGVDVSKAVFDGSMDRMRPVLMTAAVDVLGFLPMALSTSAGAEVQRPLATVVIGGVLTSTVLTLVVLPAIYRYFEPKEAKTSPADMPESVEPTLVTA